MKLGLVLLFVGLFFQVLGQNTAYFYGANGKLLTHHKGKTKIEVRERSEKNIQLKLFSFQEGEWLESAKEKWRKVGPSTYRIKVNSKFKKARFFRKFDVINDSLWRYVDYTADDLVLASGYTKRLYPLHKVDTLIEYYSDGTLMSRSIYNDNQLMSNRNWLENGVEYIHDIFYSVDQYPYYSGGNEGLNKHILKVLEKNKIDYSKYNGDLVIGFVVFENGKTGGFQVIKSLEDDLDEIVVRALQTLKGSWTPAELNGKKVKYYQKYPVHLRHDEYEVAFFDFYSGFAQIEKK